MWHVLISMDGQVLHVTYHDNALTCITIGIGLQCLQARDIEPQNHVGGNFLLPDKKKLIARQPDFFIGLEYQEDATLWAKQIIVVQILTYLPIGIQWTTIALYFVCSNRQWHFHECARCGCGYKGYASLYMLPWYRKCVSMIEQMLFKCFVNQSKQSLLLKTCVWVCTCNCCF